MEDSLKGILTTFVLASLFAMAILSFITLFPTEQGIVFTGSDSQAYLIMENATDTGIVTQLSSIQNQSQGAFNAWDVTQGFMGSNQMKQSGTGIFSFVTSLFSTLTIIAKQLFGWNSPVVYVIGVFSVLAISYVVYLLYKFVRTGN